MRRERKIGVFNVVEHVPRRVQENANIAKRGKILSCVSRDWQLGFLLVGLPRYSHF